MAGRVGFEPTMNSLLYAIHEFAVWHRGLRLSAANAMAMTGRKSENRHGRRFTTKLQSHNEAHG